MTARNLPIGEIVRNARLFRPWRRPTPDAEVTQVANDLFDLLSDRGIEYLLVGEIALLSYVESRTTGDIEIILTEKDISRLPELKVSSQDNNFAQADYRGLRVDILLTRNPFFEFVRRSFASQQMFSERTISVASPQGLTLLKFYALPSLHRQGNFERIALYETDLVMLLHRFPLSSESITTVLAEYLPEHDVRALGGVYEDIQARIWRYSGSAP